jgi:hypothetical protein
MILAQTSIVNPAGLDRTRIMLPDQSTHIQAVNRGLTKGIHLFAEVIV